MFSAVAEFRDRMAVSVATLKKMMSSVFLFSAHAGMNNPSIYGNSLRKNHIQIIAIRDMTTASLIFYMVLLMDMTAN